MWLAIVGGLIAVLAVYVQYKRGRADALSGTTAGKPVFQVEPPSRRVGRRNQGRL